VRTDEQLGRDVRACKHWKVDLFAGERLSTLQKADNVLKGGPTYLAKSFSGHERNHLFLSNQGKQFTDFSGVSGTDSDADGRAFAYWDFDRDGWQDIAIVNANAPLLNIYHNEIGRVSEGEYAGNILAIRFVGGNQKAAPSQFAPRDGYGAVVTVTAGDLSMLREHRCGEGFAAQNSDTMLIGLGENTKATKVNVRWSSGTTSDLQNIAAGSLVTVFEDATQSPNGSGYSVESYHRPVANIEQPE